MIILDTNILYAFLIKEDSLHEKAVEVLKKNKDDDLFIIPRIWEELMTLVSIRHSSEKAAIFDKVLKDSDLNWYEPKFSQNDVWIKFWEPHSPHRMSFTDCVLGYLNQEEGAKIVTFDKELQKHLK